MNDRTHSFRISHVTFGVIYTVWSLLFLRPGSSLSRILQCHTFRQLFTAKEWWRSEKAVGLKHASSIIILDVFFLIKSILKYENMYKQTALLENSLNLFFSYSTIQRSVLLHCDRKNPNVGFDSGLPSLFCSSSGISPSATGTVLRKQAHVCFLIWWRLVKLSVSIQTGHFVSAGQQ